LQTAKKVEHKIGPKRFSQKRMKNVKNKETEIKNSSENSERRHLELLSYNGKKEEGSKGKGKTGRVRAGASGLRRASAAVGWPRPGEVQTSWIILEYALSQKYLRCRK